MLIAPDNLSATFLRAPEAVRLRSYAYTLTEVLSGEPTRNFASSQRRPSFNSGGPFDRRGRFVELILPFVLCIFLYTRTSR